MLPNLFIINSLSWLMASIALSIGLIVWLFSRRFMQGDSHYKRFMVLLGSLVLSVIILIFSNNLILFVSAWGLSNLLLVQLMQHESGWNAAKASAMLAAKTFLIGFFCISTALYLLFLSSGSTSIEGILTGTIQKTNYVVPALILMLVGAMTQSGIWPFHRWLTSSLNSPTPVSAIMHAGLVNGGGFILMRFAPLFLAHPVLLKFIFCVGLFSGVTGTLWKLMQSDVKRMLACSTMGQMGFMFLQCGAGLFSGALSHLCWHGFFKAHLFLSANGAAEEKRVKNDRKHSLKLILLSFTIGAISCFAFSLISGIDFFRDNTKVIFFVLIGIITTQLSLIILKRVEIKLLLLSILINIFISMIYGLNIRFFELILPPHLSYSQPLSLIYIAGLLILLIAWGVSLYPQELINQNNFLMKIWQKFYVANLNASQPNPKTVTSIRNEYTIH